MNHNPRSVCAFITSRRAHQTICSTPSGPMQPQGKLGGRLEWKDLGVAKMNEKTIQ